jgi:signal transduction histidine kinase
MTIKMIRDANLSEQRRIEVEEANEELSRLNARLQEFDNLKTQVFANVSHELRTPLTLILGPTDRLLAAPELGDAERAVLGSIRENANTLLRHVNDLLDVARMESGEMTVRHANIDLSRLVRVAVANFESLAQERSLRLSVDAPQHLIARVDEEKLRRVLVNLVSNALKFTPDRGLVRVRVTETTGESAGALIQVADSGPGVPEELREAVFERFRQVDGGATRRHEGTGLGLSIVRDFVGLHGGTVSLDAAPEGGARFTVWLPLGSPDSAAFEPSEPEAAGAVAEETAGPTPAVPARTTAPSVTEVKDAADRATVLVVEDHPDLSRFVADVLSPHYRIVTAGDGQEGLERTLELRPDLVLSDVMMPRMSGDELLREIRSRPELESIPVVLLTAKADDGFRVDMLRRGAQDFLTKPFSPEELQARVANLVSIKRTRELLSGELSGTLRSLEELAREVSTRRQELEVAVESMRVARDHAEQASKVKTNFLRLVSHELRTPLTAIILQLQLLQRHRSAGLSVKELESVRKMSSAAGRLQDLIESLLEHARMESGRLHVEKGPLDLQNIAMDVLDEARLRAEEKSLELTCTIAAPLSPLESDRRLVRLIVSNLVDNAIKFTSRGSVEVRLEEGEGEHRIVVRDTGMGIPAAMHRSIFEPFEQLEPVSRKHTPGVGLGLALVHEMVGALGGRIDLNSEVGEGSTFTVRLPSRSAM